jgi:cadmium resistance protein CadD (predicted permease)
MLATIGSAIGLFAATNIDDIVVLTVLFLASSRESRDRGRSSQASTSGSSHSS